MYLRFLYVTTSRIAIIINSLYCIAVRKHYRAKFYFGFMCTNKYFFLASNIPIPLRSYASQQIYIPRTKPNMGKRAFSVAAFGINSQ